MSVPSPQFGFNTLDGNRFSWFWVDFFQKVYQALGLVNKTITSYIDNTFTIINQGETQHVDITLSDVHIGDSVNITLQTIDIGLVYQASIVSNGLVRIYCSNITAANIALTAGKIRITVWSF